MTIFTHETQKHWQAIQPIFSIRNEQEYDQAVERLNDLIDMVGFDESHPLYDMLDTLGTLIHAYEDRYEPIPETSGLDVLRFLMHEHTMVQSDLSQIGSQGVVSEILNAKRELNTRQIRILAKLFNVSPSVFF